VSSDEQIAYEDCLVAFIDVLGWKDAILGGKKTAQELGWLTKLLRGTEQGAVADEQFFAGLGSAYPGPAFGTRVTQFSDCIVITLPMVSINLFWTPTTTSRDFVCSQRKQVSCSGEA
jgi:hypothetical protein